MSVKQVSTIRLPLFRQTGVSSFSALTGFASTSTSVQIRTWNVEYRAELEFVGSPTTRALSGRERGNLSAYRIFVDISANNSTNEDTNKLRDLFDNMVSRKTRTFGATTLQIGEPTVMGVTVENSTAGVIHCNLINNVLGIQRELTIGNQIVQFSLKSVNLFNTIPTNLILT